MLLGHSVLAKISELVHEDERRANELWDEIDKIHNTSCTQFIENLQEKLESLIFDESKPFNNQVTVFFIDHGKLAFLDHPVGQSDKVKNIILS